ncbi:DUF2332 domain-containing protein [Lichenibacterium ramalinae]|uniref:DUF2332 domain-containing protein n=1 Tax=Lichenibacterium ramalinae TaxID=2316527 RepID=A0A4Q2RHD0_9HYPH|nr:DUF2332 family protein [Lichenibacterium ramalinae]RYB07655.1 DUF2332 domain-containing protein [Lichenibacterium ramalinae]
MTGRSERRAGVLAAFDTQVGWCEALGSPFTAAVLRAVADDIAADGIAAALTEAWPGDPLADALPLRLAGALNGLVLAGAAPDLAAAYPPEPRPAPEPLRALVAGALARHRAAILAGLGSPPQTNEVGRAAVLLGGFLRVAHETRLPLRLLEIGASAGLNGRWPAFHYRIGDRSWGDAASPVRLAPQWQGWLPQLDAPLAVAEWRGCDREPIDLGDPAQRLRLRSYVWPDQPERLARLDGAVGLALADGLRVERADAAPWLRDRLAEPASGHATVVYHSIVWKYLPAATQDDIVDGLRAAGALATADAPLAWLRFESLREDLRPTLRLTLWPGGREAVLAEAGPHGDPVAWMAD